MTDIVEHLRVGAVKAFALPVATVMDSAADEVERLRMALGRCIELAEEQRRLSGQPQPTVCCIGWFCGVDFSQRTTSARGC